MTQTHPDRPAPRQPRVSGTIQVDLRHDHCRLRSDVFALEGAWPGSTVELLVGTRRPGDLTHLLSVLAATACARAWPSTSSAAPTRSTPGPTTCATGSSASWRR